MLKHKTRVSANRNIPEMGFVSRSMGQENKISNFHPINANQLYTHDVKIEGWGGNGYIAGKTQKLGIPISGVRVTCHLRATGKLIGTTWSNEHCQYRFDNLIPGYEYYVHAIDQERKFNAVTQDILTAKEVE